MTIEDAIQGKRDQVLRIAAEHGAHDLRVFGSAARGEAGHDSDLDILAHFEPGTTLLRHAALVRELEALLGMKVDVISDRGLRDRVRDRVLKEAVPL